MGTWIVGIIVAVGLGFSLRATIKSAKKGGCSGCNGCGSKSDSDSGCS